MQSKVLKQLLQVSLSISTAVVLMETEIWSAKEHLQCSTMMLCHSIINSEEERIAKKKEYNEQLNTILSKPFLVDLIQS